VQRYIKKFVVFGAVVPGIVFCIGIYIFPLIYLIVPIFFPYFGYEIDKATSSSTIFSTEKLGWYIFAFHIITVGLVSAWASKEKIWSVSFIIYGAIVLISSLLIHTSLHAFGFQYFLEYP